MFIIRKEYEDLFSTSQHRLLLDINEIGWMFQKL